MNRQWLLVFNKGLAVSYLINPKVLYPESETKKAEGQNTIGGHRPPERRAFGGSQ